MSNYLAAILFSLFGSWYLFEDPIKEINSFAKNETTDSLNRYLLPTMPVDSPPPNPNLGPGDPTTHGPNSPWTMPNPSNATVTYELDEDGDGYYIHEQVGGIDVRPPSYISLEDYLEMRREQGMNDYFRQRAASSTGGGPNGPFSPQFPIPEGLKDIFGGGSVEIKPNGTALLDLAAEFNRMENPSLPLRQQRNANFRFDQQIQLNVVGKIGEKLRLNANWDTQATFEFENQMKLQYTGSEDEILQKIEAGNVSLPLNGSLISGGQNLFGIKVAMKFGPLTVTSIASQQKGKTKTLTATGGAQITEFQKKGNEYDEYRHFFLSHYFRHRYETALRNLPNINSPLTITRVEVYITNNNSSSTVNNRNAVGFIDLGETEVLPSGDNVTGVVFNDALVTGVASFPSNNANNLYVRVDSSKLAQEKITVESYLEGSLGLENGIDFQLNENMRKLNENEFAFHPQLGYISLNSQLQANQVLFVAYEYMLGGRVYQVGDFTMDQGKQANPSNSNVLFLKMLKPSTVKPQHDGEPFPTWDLMMKNIYNIGGYGLRADNFRLMIEYESGTQAGTIQTLPDGPLREKQLLQVFGLDNLQNNSQAGSDNLFDFLAGITINPDKGLLIFPKLEPFGSYLESQLQNDEPSINRYVFNELYEKTRADAINFYTEKDRFYIKGSYQSASSAEISLNSINVTQGSVKVSANGITLTEGVDYQVDYTIGKVTILNQGILTSGQQIQIAFETNSLFGIDSKTLVGSRFDLDVSKDIQLGGTFLFLNERPLTQKINIGDEPLSNLIWGVDGVLRKDSRWLTKMVDKLPLLQTKEISTVTAQGEFAMLRPGSPRAIKVDGENGIAYLDDFESAKTTFDLSGARAWTLSSFPGNNGNNDMVDPSADWNPALAAGFTRAKLAWYSIDPTFYFQSVTEDFPEADLNNHYTRQVTPLEVFPQQSLVNGDNLLRTFDIHYLPEIRGPYNYNADPSWVDDRGRFINPEDAWAGIQRRTSGNTDFEANNFEFIEFWMLDPFIYNTNNSGEFYLNLGQISEDVVRDGRRNFENGLPADQTGSVAVDTSEWGLSPVITPPNNAFNNDKESRQYQDVGLDGMRTQEEVSFFQGYLDTLAQRFGTTAQIYQDALSDPSRDNFQFFRGSNWDGIGILKRYEDFNNHENNTPIDASQNGYSAQGSPNPDTEDINLNGTLNTYEEYFEYKMNLRPSDMVIGRNFIVDINEATVTLPNQNEETVKWYQFRIPLTSGKPINGIQNFKAIEFVRMYMKGWSDEAILRFARFQLVSTSWRTYRNFLGNETDTTIIEPPTSLTTFEIGTVNLEDNSGRFPFNYVLPPLIDRQLVPSSGQSQLLQNEQSFVMKVCNLEDGDARAAFKLANLDLRSYNRLKMWIHAENIENSGQDFGPGELRAFIRLGTDVNQNYYEYEIPLRASVPGTTGSESVWLAENQMDFELGILNVAKAARNESGQPLDSRFEFVDGANTVIIKGTPKLSEVKSIMIGVRNKADNRGTICAEVWMNELRVTDFDQSIGWAANARANIKLADWGTVTLSGSRKTPGFGGIEQKINQRSREDITQYDVAGNFQMGKFFPKKWGLEVPLYMTYGERVVDPQFNPLESDVKMVDYVETFPTEEEKNDRITQVQDYTRNRSISLNNVRKVRVREEMPTNPNAGRGRPQTPPTKGGQDSQSSQRPKTHPWDIENFSASFSYNEIFNRNSTTLSRWQINHRAGLKYDYNFTNKPIEPFKAAKKRNIITAFNFNPLPKTLSISVNGDRRYEENSIRPTAGQSSIPTTFYKNFALTRNYNLRWDLTKSLSINYNALNTGRVDETIGAPNANSRDSLITNLLSFRPRVNNDTLWDSLGYYQLGKDQLINFGRNTRFSQTVGANYILPFDKFKATNFLSSTISYQGQFNWSAGPDNNLSLGNLASNSYTLNGTARLNLKNLYIKVPAFKKILEEQPKKKDVNPRWQQGPTGRKDPNNPENKDPEKKEGEEEEKEDPYAFWKTMGKEMLKILLSVQNVEGNYSRNMSTDLPGYLAGTDNFGMDFNYRDEFGNPSITVPPSLAFVAGLQPGSPFSLNQGATANWLSTAGNEGWISRSPEQATTFRQSFGEQLTARTSVTLFRDLRVDLNVTKNVSRNYSELFRYDTLNNVFLHENQLETGTFSMSYIFAGTSFRKEKEFSGPLYELQNNARRIISQRWYQEHSQVATPAGTGGIIPEDIITSDQYFQGYYKNNPQVLIPSFIAAFGAGKPEKIGLTAFPAIPLPNWNVNYNGLNKIPMFASIFQSVTIKHGYRGTYNVGNYTSNVSYSEDVAGFDNSFQGTALDPLTNDSIFNFSSPFQIQTVSFQEAFSPLIGINVQTKSNITAGIDFKSTRNLSLSVGNLQITETRTSDLSLSFGYRIDKLNKTLKIGAKEVKLENGLNSRLEVSLRDTKTQNIILDSDAKPTITSGNFMLIIKPSVDYVVNTKLNVRFYIEHTRNRPAISTSFPSSYTAVGFQVRFTLTN